MFAHHESAKSPGPESPPGRQDTRVFRRCTGAGVVVLEIGAGTGALVLSAPADLAGRDIEISPDREPARRRHAWVRERHGDGDNGYAAVYDRLPPGTYTIWRDPTTPAATVTVAAGVVTSHDWPCGPSGRARATPPLSPPEPGRGPRDAHPGS